MTIDDINLIVYVAVALVAVYGLLRGLRKGLYKSLIDLGVFLITAIASIFIAKALSKALVNVEKLQGILTTLCEWFPDMSETLADLQSTITSMPEDMVSMVMVLPTVFLAPIVFIIVYFLLGFILKIPKIIIARSIFGPNGGEEYHGGSRIFGGVVGAVTRIAAFAVVLIPLVGYINLANDSLTNMTTAQPAEAEELVEEPTTGMDSDFDSVGSTLSQIQADYVSPIADNFAVKSVYACGGKWIFNTLSSVNVNSIDITLSNELNVLTSMYDDVTVIMGTPVPHYGEKQVQAINNITDTMDSAVVIPSLVSSAFSYASQQWLDGNAVFGIEKVKVGDYYEPTLDKILTMLASTTQETVKLDLHTLGNILGICVENELFKELLDGGNVINTIERETFLGEIFLELYKNEKTKALTVDLVNAFKNYIYKVYNGVNETNIPYPTQFVVDDATEEMIYEEGVRISDIVRNFRIFTASLDMSEEDNTQFLINTDVRSLGKALDKLKVSLLFGDSYEFLLGAVLKSEGAYQFAFITPEFIDAMLENQDTSMETVLVSRQQIAIIASSVKSNHKSEAIQHLITNIDLESAPIIKETFTSTILENFGMNPEEAETMSSALGSIVDEIASNDVDLTEEELQKEVEAVDKILTTVQSASKTDGKNVFATEGEEGGLNADELVETVMGSQITSSAITSSSVDEEGNAVEDPYKIANKINEQDKDSAKNAIENYYSSNAVPDGDNTELEATLGSLANIFGVQVDFGK